MWPWAEDLRKMRCQEKYWMIYRGRGFLVVVWLCSSTHKKTEKERQIADGRGRGGGSQITQRWESLVLYKSFKTALFECINICSSLDANGRQMVKRVRQQAESKKEFATRNYFPVTARQTPIFYVDNYYSFLYGWGYFFNRSFFL